MKVHARDLFSEPRPGFSRRFMAVNAGSERVRKMPIYMMSQRKVSLTRLFSLFALYTVALPKTAILVE